MYLVAQGVDEFGRETYRSVCLGVGETRDRKRELSFGLLVGASTGEGSGEGTVSVYFHAGREWEDGLQLMASGSLDWTLFAAALTGSFILRAQFSKGFFLRMQDEFTDALTFSWCRSENRNNMNFF
jgi:hypothetical protein